MKKFLTARWRDLIMVNYEVEPSLLRPFVPAGTDLDLHEGRCFISLVAFMFLDTRVMKFIVPFHVNFEEVNLRFYVTRETRGETRRGVVFIREFVPRRAIAFVAKAFCGEPYQAARMGHSITDDSVSYSWSFDGTAASVSVEAGDAAGVPEPDSHGEFIIEHYWGYTKRSGGRTDEYKVEHPKWELREARNAEVNVDFAAAYGPEFAGLTGQQPFSVLLANGSEVAVYKGGSII